MILSRQQLTPVLLSIGLLAGSLLSLPASAAERTYKWVDDKGQVHYGGMPPPGVKAERIAGPPPPPTGARTDGGGAASKQFEQKPDAAGKSGANGQADSTPEPNKAQCDLSKKNLEILKTQKRITITDPDGKSRTMPEEERAEQIKKAEQGVTDFCK